MKQRFGVHGREQRHADAPRPQHALQPGRVLVTGSIGYVPDALQIGGKSGSTATEHWKGRIDDLRIYHRALTPTEISRLYKLTE